MSSYRFHDVIAFDAMPEEKARQIGEMIAAKYGPASPYEFNGSWKEVALDVFILATNDHIFSTWYEDSDEGGIT